MGITNSSEGLKLKYIITHADGSPVDPKKRYFVLSIDSEDPEHRNACRKALAVYAQLVGRVNSSLYKDLRGWLGKEIDFLNQFLWATRRAAFIRAASSAYQTLGFKSVNGVPSFWGAMQIEKQDALKKECEAFNAVDTECAPLCGSCCNGHPNGPCPKAATR